MKRWEATRMSPRPPSQWKGIKGTLKIGHRAAEEEKGKAPEK